MVAEEAENPFSLARMSQVYVPPDSWTELAGRFSLMLSLYDLVIQETGRVCGLWDVSVGLYVA